MHSISSTAVDYREGLQTRTEPVRPDCNAPARSRLLCALFALVALLPVIALLLYAHALNRNIPYFDEIDSAIALLLRLDSGLGFSDFVQQMLAITNEHRTVTSRLLFAVSFGLTGTVNFLWIGVIGNAFIVLACGLLILGVETTLRRLRLATVLGLLLFHLGNYESFFWSGSSIDHFQVVTLAIAAFLALQRRSRFGFGIAVVSALLATLTLAHGLVTWPVGAALLARDRLWREAGVWLAAGALASVLFFAGFETNPGHHIGSHGPATAAIVVSYWLRILGAPLAFGHAAVATALGAALVLVTTARSFLGAWSRGREVLPLLWFVLGSALLVAIGRAEMSGGAIASRYLILGGLGWALLLFDAIDRLSSDKRPFLALGAAVPCLLAFNIAQTLHHRGDALTFIENRDRAALRFLQHGEDGRGAAKLHPLPQHATGILALAEARGVYRLPPLCHERSFSNAKPSSRLTYYVDEFTLNDRAAYLAGWVTLPERALQRGEIHLVLRSTDVFRVFTTVPIRRPDVVQAFDNPDWEHTGFRAVIERSRLAPGDYQVGFLVTGGDAPEFIMTAHQLHLVGAGSVTFPK